jgi:hypothetical protein
MVAIHLTLYSLDQTSSPPLQPSSCQQQTLLLEAGASYFINLKLSGAA